MSQIIIVHGIGMQYRGPRSLRTDLGDALIDGVTLAGGPTLTPEDVSVAFYGSWFRAPGSKGNDLTPATDGFSMAEHEFLQQAWRYASIVEPTRIPLPDRQGTKVPVPQSTQRALTWLSTSHWLSGAAEGFMLGILRQVRQYMTDQATRSVVLDSLRQSITQDTSVIIGHSLGSVIAYEALCENPGWPVRAFVTLGSPLGVRNIVFDRLTPRPENGVATWPGGIKRWTNVCDKRDVVALVKSLQPLFGRGPLRINDRLVENGWRAHDIQRHLTAVETGEAVKDALLELR